MTETADLALAQAPFVAPDGTMLGERLSEKPIPEQFRQQIDDHLRQRTFRSKKDRLWILNNIKLDIYYPYENLIYYDEGDDWIVLAHGRWSDARIRFIVENLTEEQSRKVVLATPEPWDQ